MAADEGSKNQGPGRNQREGLNQRRRLPVSNTTLAVGGILLAAAIGYFYVKKKPEFNSRDSRK